MVEIDELAPSRGVWVCVQYMELVHWDIRSGLVCWSPSGMTPLKFFRSIIDSTGNSKERFIMDAKVY